MSIKNGKKMKVNVPYSIYSVVKKDEENFGLRENNLMNRLYNNYNGEISTAEINSKLDYTIQFRLNKENCFHYDQTIATQNISASEYLRNILWEYVNNPQYQREKIVFKDNYDKINEAMENQKCISIEYRNSTRQIEPYFIKESKEEEYNYVFAWCYKNDEYRNYRLSNIENVLITECNYRNYNEKEIAEHRENFDPFLSFKKEIKVKFTEDGLELYKKAFHLRPKLIDEDGAVMTFECSPKKAEIYFAHFFDDVEILSPIEVRDFFEKKHKLAAKRYK